MTVTIIVTIVVAAVLIFMVSLANIGRIDSRHRDYYEMMQEQCNNCLYKREYMKRQKDGEQDDKG